MAGVWGSMFHLIQRVVPVGIVVGLLAIVARVEAGPWFDGGDLSALGKIEKLGGKFHDRAGTETDAIRALASFGANCVRLRLFVEPNGERFVVNDLPYTLELARRAKAAGQAVLLDLHYSDTWADPAHQHIPKSWPQDSLDGLVERIENYSCETIRRFDEAGLLPELVQIGNEIDNGILWPVGKIWKPGAKSADWDSVAALLQAAAKGVRRATPAGKRIRIVVHTATGGDARKSATFHSEMQRSGLDYDVAGLSYYPWWHGTLEDLDGNARRLVARFGKEVFVVEAAFPWNEGGNGRKDQGKDYRWAKTVKGQADYLREVVEVIRGLPDGKGIGVMWWHPDSVAIKGAGVWMGGACALWRENGAALPALEGFAARTGARRSPGVR